RTKATLSTPGSSHRRKERAPTPVITRRAYTGGRDQVKENPEAKKGLTFPQGERFTLGHVMDGGLKIGELARRAGVTAKAIRFYETRRILPPPQRGPNRYRVYGA